MKYDKDKQDIIVECEKVIDAIRQVKLLNQKFGKDPKFVAMHNNTLQRLKIECDYLFLKIKTEEWFLKNNKPIPKSLGGLEILGMKILVSSFMPEDTFYLLEDSE